MIRGKVLSKIPVCIVSMGVMGIVLYFLLGLKTESTSDLLPYLIILLCPLMHTFMHSKGGGCHQHGDQEERGEKKGKGVDEYQLNKNKHDI